MNFIRSIYGLLLAILVTPLLYADALDDLARDFWTWRAVEQPFSSDDIPRIERPDGWLPNWSPENVARFRQQLSDFETRWKKMESATWPIPRQVDYRLIGSALARVRWELDTVRGWQRNPEFYVDQSLSAYYHLLLPSPPFTAERSQQIISTLNSIPKTLENGKQNLTQPAAPFAHLALHQLRDVGARLLQSVAALKPLLQGDSSRQIDAAAEHAATALEAYRDWLNQRLPAMSTETAVGRQAYQSFLKNVALMPFTPEQLLAMGGQEWARAVDSQIYEEHRNAGVPELSLFKDQAEQAAHEEKDELAVRRYVREKDILAVPDWVQHYRFQAMPAYLAPLEAVAEGDDFTSPERLNENSTRYIDAPSPTLGYFALTTAKDPRGEIVHEGVPGHYFQLALSWRHPDPIRRHYYDSGANEGIGFYAEEMMLHAGLFDNSPRSREIIWNFMRLRALRVEVDVKLALGEFSIEQAAEYLQSTVPMDAQTAHAEAAFFASIPGQAISYQIGKLQINKFLADAQRQKKNEFSLRSVHDFVWQNGNVPIILQRWEYLGLKDEIDLLERMP
jgi:uncharacterized protein (DUF885 family)